MSGTTNTVRPTTSTRRRPRSDPRGPMDEARLRVLIGRLRADARAKARAAASLEKLVAKLCLRCHSGIVVPITKSGVYRTEAAYVQHTLDCRQVGRESAE